LATIKTERKQPKGSTILMRHKTILLILIFAALGLVSYYILEYRSLDEVNAKIRSWQASAANYIAFDYSGVSHRLGRNTITLNQVHVTYPILMSIDKLVLHPQEKDGVLVGLQMSGEGVNFTWPGVSGATPWQGDVQVDYQYQLEARQVQLRVMLDFPQQLRGNGTINLSKITPNVDLVFNYPEILLDSMQFKLQNQGIIQAHAALPSASISSDQLLMNWMNTLATSQQRQAFAEFWANNALLMVDFQPDKPVPVHRITRNERLLWQHPAIQMQVD
jgi:hypothetical protein